MLVLLASKETFNISFESMQSEQHLNNKITCCIMEEYKCCLSLVPFLGSGGGGTRYMLFSSFLLRGNHENN